MADERFRAIYGKWQSYKVPQHIGDLLSIAGKPVSTLLSDLVRISRRAGLISTSQAVEESQKAGVALGMATRVSFFIGVECADEVAGRQRNHRPSDDDSLQISVDFEEWAVIEACIEMVRQYILRKTRLASQSLTRQENDVLRAIENVEGIVRNAAMDATEDLPDTKLHTRLRKAMAFNQLLISTFASVDEAVSDWRETRPPPSS